MEYNYHYNKINSNSKNKYDQLNTNRQPVQFRVRKLIAMADLQANKRCLVEACHLMNKAVNLDKTNTIVLLKRARLHYSMANYDAALKDTFLVKSLSSNIKELNKARMIDIDVFTSLHNWKEIIRICDQILEIDNKVN